MKVILYFGHHKVGSTALQAYLARNTLALLKKGILYPAVESQGLSHLLAQATGQHRSPDLTCMNLREPHNALAFRMLAETKTDPARAKTPPWHGHLPQSADMLATLRHQIDLFQPHTVILCSEVMANFGRQSPELIDTLRSVFPEAEFELYCVLRRPDDYLASWFGQRLRFGRALAALDQGTALKDSKGIHFNYRKMVDPWAAVFPDSPLYLRTYDQVMAAGGSVEDFTATVGCSFPRGLSQKGPRNDGLHRAAFEIQRRANQELPRPDAQALLQVLLQKGRTLAPVSNSEVELFGVDLRRQLHESFQPIDQYLAKQIGAAQFFEDLDWMRRPAPMPLALAHDKLLANLAEHNLPSPVLNDFIQSLTQDKMPDTSSEPTKSTP